ncbi:transcriptional activator HlyU [Roseovarius sp. A-2]|uniref:HlyU family transcriptional regulator n=1 Tax=Roseovarius sp. A-2 TaxID=1570360 RepID=UPI0009B56391|nr:HlyU family transcriptional regulator [Roseovarius sp. A-2]GAW35672.1 transcriptional activator HlyU [Roseovarius sp. A-2]
MSILSRLFGGGTKPETRVEPSETYKEFRIIAAPQSDADGYRVGARIEKDVDGEVRVHHLLRADTLRSLENAEAFSIRKAKQVIDEQGERIFG